MNGIALAVLLLALLCAGCVDQKGNNGSDKVDAKTASVQAGAVEDKLSLAITSPRAGDILTGDREFDFSADVKGGKGPYTYSWTSNIDGLLSSEKSFSKRASELSKGEHNLILKATDSSGNSAQSSVLIRVM
jgi:hypothetical protein